MSNLAQTPQLNIADVSGSVLSEPMTIEKLENRIGFQIGFLLHSEKSIESTIENLKNIAIDYAKQFQVEKPITEIIVLGTKINTKEITAIYEIERDKKMFLNREAGFVIMFMDGTHKTFKENIPYESYSSEISAKKERWAKLQKEVTEKWEKDKHQFEEFGLNVKVG